MHSYYHSGFKPLLQEQGIELTLWNTKFFHVIYKNSVLTSQQHSASPLQLLPVNAVKKNKVFAYSQNNFKSEVPVHTIK